MPYILDRHETLETFRQRVLAALDDAAVQVFGTDAGWQLPAQGKGAVDADLPPLFAAIDDQVDRIAERVGAIRVDQYQGVDIKLHPFEGYHAAARSGVNFGYTDNVADIREEIADNAAEEAEHYRDQDTPPDTPSLDTSFHDHEMDV